MNIAAVESGKVYRVTKSPAWEYLTVGHIYKAWVSSDAIGMHRPTDGAGTYIGKNNYKFIEVEEV